MSKLWKKAGVSALSVVMMTGFVTGCGSANNSGTAGTNSTSSSVAASKLDIFSWWTGTASSHALKAMLDVYTSKYPNVSVVNDAVSGGAGSNAKAVLTSRMHAGNPPDTFQVHNGQELFSWVQAGEMQPLNDLYKQNGLDKAFPKKLIDMVSYKGSIYGVPVDMQRGNVIWYNPSIFKKYNLQPPTTWPTLWTDLDVLKKHNITPFALANHGGWESVMLWEESVLGTVGEQKYDQIWQGKVSFTDPGIKKATERFLKILSYTNSDYASLHWADADGLVADGKAGMNQMGDWAQGYFTTTRGLKPNQGFAWAPFPGTKGVFEAIIDCFGLPKGAPNEKAAKNLLVTFASQKAQDAFNPLKGTFSPRTDADTSKYDAYSQDAMKSFANDPLVPSLAHGGAANPAFVSAATNAMTELLSTKNVDQFLSNLQSAEQSNPFQS